MTLSINLSIVYLNVCKSKTKMDEYLPVYKILYTQSVEKKMPMTKMDSLSKKINSLDPDGHEIILALIYYYFYNTNKYIPVNLPYEGSNMVWSVQSLPDRLKWMLYNFTDKHLSIEN